MHRRFFGLIAISGFLYWPQVLSAQPGSASAVIRDRLDRARTALNDLQYLRADTIARDVLGMGNQLPRAGRVEALQVLAAANFPELQDNRNIAQARSALAALLRIDLAAAVPPDLSWRGLDSLFLEVSRETYAISVLVRKDNPIDGINGVSPIRVRANRPSSFVLYARSKDGVTSILLDSVGVATDTVLSLRVGRNGVPIMQGGSYDFAVRSTELVSREAISRVFDGVAVVPELTYALVPPVDSTNLLPVRSQHRREATIVGGALVSAATFAIGKALRARAPIADGGEVDRKYRLVSVAILGATIGAAIMDKGQVLDKNIAANTRTIEERTARSQGALRQNAIRAFDFRASIALNPEPG